MATVSITTRSNNVGIGWTNQPEQVRTSGGGGFLRVRDVSAPRVVGTPKQALAELEVARRLNSGNDWRYAFFVDGQRVRGVAGIPADVLSVTEALRTLRPGDTLELETEEAEG